MIVARAQFRGRTILGVVEGDAIRPIRADAFEGGMSIDREGVVVGLAAALAGALEASLPLREVRLTAPVPRPGKIICVGANYRAHADEARVKVPDFPEIFAKFDNAIIGPGDPIPANGPDPRVDWEGELAVVIGRTTRQVAEPEALGAVAGYTVANDISARTWQTRVSQWVTGKTFDGFCPLGPWLATPDEVPDPQALRLTTILNGETVQDASTNAMLFPISTLIAYLSSVITLEAGDLILTGTPEGVGLHRTPPRFLVPGDRIAVEVERVGRLENPVGP